MLGDLLQPQTFDFFARFLLSGFVFIAARSRFVVGERPAAGETIVEAVILSLVNQAVYRFGFALPGLLPATPAPTEGAFFVEVLALPALLGALFGWLVSWNRVPAGFRRLIMPVTRPVPEAYEQAFAQVEAPCYLIVGFDDGREVLGYFGERSFAGTDPRGGGIFIEDVYVVHDDQPWRRADPPRSVWLSLEGARSIEFLNRDGE